MKFEDVKAGYANMWAGMKIRPERVAELEQIARTLIANREHYEGFGAVPWYFIAVLHMRESGLDKHGQPRFDCYLGNGQPLNQRTTIVPKNRGPFSSFREGVIDALTMLGYDTATDWSIAHMLWRIECYNGLGYFGKINSPYLWSWTAFYRIGKFDRDGHYDAGLVDAQPGAAPMLKMILDLIGGAIAGATSPATPEAPVPVSTVTTSQNDIVIQHILTAIGAMLVVLGFTHAKDWYDAVVNSQFIGGAIVMGIGYVLNRIGINRANSNTLAMIDAIAVKIGALASPPPPAVAQDKTEKAAEQ